MSAPFNHRQEPRPLPVLRPGRRLSWVRVRQIALDSNGNDTTGHYYGRNPPQVLYRIDYSDGSWQAFWGPGKRIDLLANLHRNYRKATVEIAPAISLEFSPNIDHAHEQPIDFNAKPIEPKAAPTTKQEEAGLSRGEKWKLLRARRRPKPPDAQAYSKRLQQRLKELQRDTEDSI